jgi:hypothetical protein
LRWPGEFQRWVWDIVAMGSGFIVPVEIGVEYAGGIGVSAGRWPVAGCREGASPSHVAARRRHGGGATWLASEARNEIWAGGQSYLLTAPLRQRKLGLATSGAAVVWRRCGAPQASLRK